MPPSAHQAQQLFQSVSKFEAKIKELKTLSAELMEKLDEKNSEIADLDHSMQKLTSSLSEKQSKYDSLSDQLNKTHEEFKALSGIAMKSTKLANYNGRKTNRNVEQAELAETRGYSCKP
jgi:chromosome segregation ATPase